MSATTCFSIASALAVCAAGSREPVSAPMTKSAIMPPRNTGKARKGWMAADPNTATTKQPKKVAAWM